MANKRMFSMRIVDSDAFLDMPLSTQCLYFHLNMRADDDGFVDNTKRIMRLIGSSDDDFKLLVAKRFILTFDDGVIVIKHWRMHNTLSSGRYHETQYIDEKSMLKLKKNGSYTFDGGREIDDTRLVEMSKRQSRRTIDEQVENADIDLDKELDLDKDLDKELDKELKEKDTKVSQKKRFIKPTVEEVENYVLEKGYSVDAESFVDFYESKGWYVGKNKMQDWKAAVRTWQRSKNKTQNNTFDEWANA